MSTTRREVMSEQDRKAREFKRDYKRNLLDKMHDLQRDGITRMSARNLFEITDAPRGYYNGTNARYYQFQDMAAIIDETPTLRQFTRVTQ